MRTLIRILLGLCVPLFLMAAWVQLNDADPILWGTIYLAAAAICGFAAATDSSTPIAGWFAAACAAWSLVLAWQLATADAWQAMHPEQVDGAVGLLQTEKGREMLGLAIISAATALAAWYPGADGED